MYARSGKDIIPETWLVAVVKRNLPIKISTDLPRELRKLQIVDEIHNAINVYRHYHRTGMPKGMTGIMIVMAQRITEEKHDIITTTICTHGNCNGNNDANKQATTNTEHKQEDFNVAAKGGKTKGKGYG